MTSFLPKSGANSWYSEPWPWLLMAGPLIVVVAGLFTAWLAVRSDDGLVADDYYKQGLAINQTLRRDALAADLRYRATATASSDRDRIRLHLTGAAQLPEALRLTISHPTRSGLDQTISLRQVEPGWYESPLHAPERGRWHLTLEDAQRTWRMTGTWHLAGASSIVFDNPAPPPVN
jgi:hypothetical protein